MVAVPADRLSAGLVHLVASGAFPPLAHGLVQAQLHLTSRTYATGELLPSSLGGHNAALVAGTRAALLLVQAHALPGDISTIQASRWLFLASADDGPLALDVVSKVPIAPAAGQVEAHLSSADGDPGAEGSRRALRALSALLWACRGPPAHPLLAALGEARTVAVMAHVARLYRSGVDRGGVAGLALAWDAMESTLLLTGHGGAALPPAVLEVAEEVRAAAHAVQHALDDPAAPSDGLGQYDVLCSAVAECVPDAAMRRSHYSLRASPPPSPPPPPHPLVERRNVFSDADLLRARRVTRDAPPLAALDEDAKRAIVARGLAESDEEEEGGTLGVFANPFGAAREDDGVDGDSGDDEAAGVVPPRGDPAEDDDEPTGIYRRQRVVLGSNPRGVNDWRTRAEDWEVSSSDEGDLPGPQAPISSSRGEASASASTSASAAGGVQLGDERILLAAYGAAGGAKDLTQAGRRGKARTQLKDALGGRWDDHMIESWASMLNRNPKKDALLAPFTRTGNVLYAGGNVNLRAGPAASEPDARSEAKGKSRPGNKNDTKGEKKDEKKPLNEREKRNKERRGNVARKKGADRKAARTGVFPTE